jgi:hypothetical protein
MPRLQDGGGLEACRASPLQTCQDRIGRATNTSMVDHQNAPHRTKMAGKTIHVIPG